MFNPATLQIMKWWGKFVVLAAGVLIANNYFTVTAVMATVEPTLRKSLESQFPTHDVRNCPLQQWFDSSQSSRLLEVLPGLGFDNLRHLDMGQVHFYNYSRCKVTADGKFIIPDSAFIVPTQESHYKFSADYFDHWDNYTSITSSNVKSGFSLFNFIGGAFSKEKQSVKQNQVNHKSKTTRVTFRNAIYNIKLDTSAELHPTFKSRVYEIAARLQNNDTEMASYLSELLVRDYGTHYITSVETGAVFAKLDYISESYASHEEASNVAYAAAFSLPILQLFNGSFDLGYSHSYSENKVNAFFSNRKRSEIFTIGGAPFTPDLNLTRWLLEVPDKMAIIDRTADPLHFVLTPSRFPELLPTTIREVSDYVLTAIGWYYQYNTRPGCMNPKAKNFDFQANYDDSSYCDTHRSYEDMIFGGVYQTCTYQGREDLCNGVLKTAHVNPQTGTYSCPPGYQSVLLQQASVSYSKQYQRSKKKCKFLGLFCSTRTYFETHVSRARYQTYWCVATRSLKPDSYRGYLFGGYFTPSNSNPLTGAQSCPPYFRNQKMASDVTLCVSNDYELGSVHSVKFGGFHSCRIGNPLAIPSNLHSNRTMMFTNSASWPHSCPAGYSQHLVDVDDGCEINVCLESGAFSPKYSLPPFLPPFHERPPFIPHWTDRLAVVGADNNLLIRSTQGQWKAHSADSDETKAFIQTAMEYNNITESSAFGVAAEASQEKDGPSKWALISLIMSTVALASFSLLACMTSVVTCKVCCSRKRKAKIEQEANNYAEQGRVPLIMPPNLESKQL